VADDEPRGRKVTLLAGGRLVPIRDQDIWIMAGAPLLIVGLTLWIACSNVGTLLLARGGPRQREIAIRIALGASRPRVVRQLITESVMLAILGGAAGWLFAVWSNSTMDWMRPMLPEFVNVELKLDWTSFFFAFLLTVISGILFGLAPALQAVRSEVVHGLKGNMTRGRNYRWFSSRNMLVFQQVAGSLMLLLITGFVVLGFNRSVSPDLGFDAENIHMVSIDPVRDGYSPGRTADFLASLAERIKQLPGIEEATITYKIPLGMFSDESVLEAKTGVDLETLRSLRVERVSTGFFETVGVPILRGRAFRKEDLNGSSFAAIVNETMADATWPGEDPIGNSIEIEGRRYVVVGVTKNFRSGALLETSRPGAFIPMSSREIARPSAMGLTLMARALPGFDAAKSISQEIRTIDPDLTILSTSRLQDDVKRMMSMVHITTLTYGGIGLFGLILACVGLGGVTAYTVSQRTKEIGIRMALGARRFDVLGLVLKEGLILVAVGTIAGQALAWAAVRSMGRFFDALATMTETSTSDPLLVVGAPFLLGTLTMLACLMPARRATKIDPLDSLRQE
jgi:predicted permease